MSRHIVFIFLALAGGVAGTWFFATWESLSRSVRDWLSMTVLVISLLIAGILIVATLIRAEKLSSQTRK